jgi:hypothetical protein
MTALVDTKLILETTYDRLFDNTDLNLAGDSMVSVDPFGLRNFAIPNSPTNEEKAQLIKDSFGHWFRETVIREYAERAEREGNAKVSIKAAGDSAVTDLT